MVRIFIVLLSLISFSSALSQTQDTIYLNQEDGLALSAISKTALSQSDSIKFFSNYKKDLEKRVIAWVNKDQQDSAKIGADIVTLLDSALQVLETNYNLAERLLEDKIGQLYQEYGLDTQTYVVSVKWTTYGAVFFFERKKL